MYRCAVLPGYTPQPGGVDLTDVYSDGLQLGWNVNSTSNITLQEVPIGINGTLAMCANMPASQVRRQQLVIQNVHLRVKCQLQKRIVYTWRMYVDMQLWQGVRYSFIWEGATI